jgi:hypothetical protein
MRHPVVVDLPAPLVVAARMPAPAEARRLRMDRDRPVPVLVAGGRLWRADLHELRIGGPAPAHRHLVRAGRTVCRGLPWTPPPDVRLLPWCTACVYGAAFGAAR